MVKKVKKDEMKEYVDKTKAFVKKNPLASVIGAVLIGYSIGRLLHKREK